MDMPVEMATENPQVLIALGCPSSETELAIATLSFDVHGEFEPADGNDVDTPKIEAHYYEFNISSPRLYVEIDDCSAQYQIRWETKNLPSVVREAINAWLEKEEDGLSAQAFEFNGECT